MRGLIALDIDGTVTVQHEQIRQEVVDVLSALKRDGFVILFISGRPFPWAEEVLRSLPFPCFAAVQNGAILVEWPSKSILHRQYVSTDVFASLEAICVEEKTDFALYCGMEHGDVVYYRPERFLPGVLEYIQKRFRTLRENWVACASYREIPLSAVPSVKCFGDALVASRLEEKITNSLFLHAPAIVDPFDPSYRVVQITHPQATKGQTVKAFRKRLANNVPVIAAGDDFNDRDMLQEADISIVMETADPSLYSLGDIIAPSASRQGIIEGLRKAVALLNQ